MRVILKISGETLQGKKEYGIDNEFVKYIASEIKQIKENKIEIGIVLGAGNIMRGGSETGNSGMDRTQSDNMGMLAITINSIYLGEILEDLGIKTKILTATSISGIGERFSAKKAREYLKQGYVVLFSGGIGNPYFTTDTGGVLRALETNSDFVIKATKVDGIYDKDPKKYSDAKMIKNITYDEVIKNNLKVMDLTAIIMAKEGNLKIKVVNLYKPGSMFASINGEDIGTTVY